jgi:hypothetical protein
VQFIRATCDNYETAGPELAVQQNVCLVWNSWLALATIAYLVVIGLALYFVWLIGSAVVILLVTVVPAIAGLVQFNRPEYIPGTGMASEPIDGGDEYIDREGPQ